MTDPITTPAQVTVTITDKGAIYINDSRITGRNTKWGNHQTLDEFTCPMTAVVAECVKRGWDRHVRNIDTTPYLEQRVST